MFWGFCMLQWLIYIFHDMVIIKHKYNKRSLVWFTSLLKTSNNYSVHIFFTEIYNLNCLETYKNKPIFYMSNFKTVIFPAYSFERKLHCYGQRLNTENPTYNLKPRNALTFYYTPNKWNVSNHLLLISLRIETSLSR